MNDSDGQSPTPYQELITALTHVSESGEEEKMNNHQSPKEIETLHRQVKALCFCNPTPSLVYFHVTSNDDVHQNFYLNKEHLTLLHTQSGKALDDMK